MIARSAVSSFRLLILLSAALVSACAGNQWRSWPWGGSEQAPVDASKSTSQVARLKHWRINGRIGVQHKEQGFSASIDWRQQDDDFDIRLAAPLNGGSLQFRGGPEGVVMVQADGSVDQAPDVERLMARHLGWTIPVEGAAYWVRGLVAPNAEVVFENRDQQQRLTDFEQLGWRVSILDRVQYEDLELPRKLFLTHPTLKVRLVIKVWERI